MLLGEAKNTMKEKSWEEKARILEENISGNKRPVGFHCKKHRLSMFSMDYCPICVSERVYGKSKVREVKGAPP